MIIKVNYEDRGKHIFGRVFMGPHIDGLTLCGGLMFKESEFKAYRKVLEDGALLSKDIQVQFKDATGGSERRLPKIKGID